MTTIKYAITKKSGAESCLMKRDYRRTTVVPSLYFIELYFVHVLYYNRESTL